ncbi:MAG: hypothetical protein K5644_05000 [Lachnospiraceae bacterium]|nr:hypothetical protein [Lachnospiraceae bacterium]
MIDRDEMHEVIKKETHEAVKAAIVGAAEMERRKRKKARRKKFFKFVRKIIYIGLFVCAGYMIGVHRNVIKAYFKGEKLPKLPKGHPDCWLHHL